jgi:membrane protein DedA with SNARE-associated domain/rhodanese-related sulfurtransferase
VNNCLQAAACGSQIGADVAHFIFGMRLAGETTAHPRDANHPEAALENGKRTSMRHLIILIQQYGLPFVFLNVLLEQGGLPIPAYPTLLIAAALAATSTYRPYQIVAVAVLAALSADSLWYLAGRRMGYRVMDKLCRVSLSPDSCVRKTRALFTRFGPASLTFAKFVPGFGLLSTTMAGASRTPLRTFVVLDLVGALLWSSVAVILGVTFRTAIDDVLVVLSDLGKWGLLLIVVALAGYVLSKWWQRWRFMQRLRMDRISVDELTQLIATGRAPVIFDVRSAAHRDESGTIPGAMAIDVNDPEPMMDALLRDSEVVLYCACPNEASAAIVARHLIKQGFKKVRPLHGGIDAWVAAGHAVERPILAGAAA